MINQAIELLGQLKTVNEIVICSAMVMAFWTVVFGFLMVIMKTSNLPKKTASSIGMSIGGIIHDMWILIAVPYNLYKNGINMGGSDFFPTFIEIETANYFFIHGVFLIMTKLFTKEHQTHHFFTITATWAAVLLGFSNCGAIVNLNSHFSHIPLHVRGILKDLNLKFIGAYEVVETLYFILYIFERSISLTYIMKLAIFDYSVSAWAYGLFTMVWIQSQFFTLTMLKLFKRKYANYLERQKKGIHYEWFSENPECSKLSYYNTKESKKDKVM